jgi:hypothetical protein
MDKKVYMVDNNRIWILDFNRLIPSLLKKETIAAIFTTIITNVNSNSLKIIYFSK